MVVLNTVLSAAALARDGDAQSSIAVTHYIQTATNLTTPKGWKVWLALSAPGVEPRSSCMDTHERAHRGVG